MNYQQLYRYKSELEKEAREIKEVLKTLPEGKIVFSHTGKYSKWYQSDGKNKKYIPKKNKQLAEKLAKKKYLTLRLADIVKELKVIKQCVQNQKSEVSIADKLLEESSDYQKLLSPYFKSKSKTIEEWKNAEYARSRKHPEHLLFKSISGNVVRSKSELLIDLLLFNNKIPYRYEEEITFGGVKLCPDFTILHPQSRTIIYWEHFGMMEDADYIQTTYKKLKLYALNGYVPTINLITTYETKDCPLDMNSVQKIIDEYLLN